MMKIKRAYRVTLILLVIGLLAYAFRPWPAIDDSKVHPSLRGLGATTRCDWTTFGDGGTRVIHLVRPDGREVMLCLANSLDDSFQQRGQLFLGAMHPSMPGAVKITGYDHTRFVVARLLARDLPLHPGVRADIALLTRRLPDWISLAFHEGPEAFVDFLHLTW